MYIYDHRKQGEKKLEDFEDRFEYSLISDKQSANNYFDSLSYRSKVNFNY